MSGSSGRGPTGEGSGGEGSPSGEEATKTKGKSKSKLGAFKSLREVSRSGSFRIGSKKKSGDEGSGDSLAGEGSETGKMGSKKKADEGSAAVKESEERESGAPAEGAVSTKKKKKKKGSSLVRKLSSKYRNRLSPTEAAKKVDTLTEETDASLSLTEAATISLPEDDEEEDLRSVSSGVSTATGSTGGGTQSRASDNPPTVSSLSGPAMSSSTSSSASVGTPPSAQEHSPETKSPPPETKDGRISPGSVSPIRSYLPMQTPSSFPTTFPLYYKPSQTSSIVRRSVTPPFQPPSTSHGGRPEASSPVWGVRPRGPLGLSIKAREHEEVVTYSFTSTTKEPEKNIGSENAGGAEGLKEASESTATTEEGEGEGESRGEERIGEEAPPTVDDDEHRDSQEPSLLTSGSEATVEECSKVEVVKEELAKGAGEVGKEEETAMEKEKEIEGAVGEGASGSGEVSGEATVEQPLEKSPEKGVQDVERKSPPKGDMEEAPETSTALASGGGGASAAGSSSGAAVMLPGVGTKREHLYKILVIGELGTGKTSIIKRYVHQFFSQHYRATIGVDFALKVINWDADTIIRLQLWDIAGQERFGNMTRVYYKEAVGAFIVFDVTRSATFESVVKWKVDLDSKVQLPDGSPIPCVLLANKCDQQKEGIVNNPAKMEEYCKEKGFAGWYETSAKENINIEDAARFLVTKILKNDRLTGIDPSKDSDRFALEGSGSGMNGDGVRGGNGRQEGKSCAC